MAVGNSMKRPLPSLAPTSAASDTIGVLLHPQTSGFGGAAGIQVNVIEHAGRTMLVVEEEEGLSLWDPTQQPMPGRRQDGLEGHPVSHL